MPINCLKDKPVNEVANPGAEYENSNGADKTIDRNQLEAVRLRMRLMRMLTVMLMTTIMVMMMTRP